MTIKPAVVLLLMLSPNANASNHKSNSEEVEVFAAALKAEIASNHWASSDGICISVAERFPSARVLKELRKYNLNVYSQKDWPHRIACSYSVQLGPAEFNQPKHARVDLQSSDLRGINRGEEDIATLVDKGSYELANETGHWNIIGFSPK